CSTALDTGSPHHVVADSGDLTDSSPQRTAAKGEESRMVDDLLGRGTRVGVGGGLLDGGGGPDRGLAEQGPVGLPQAGEGLCFVVFDAGARSGQHGTSVVGGAHAAHAAGALIDV